MSLSQLFNVHLKSKLKSALERSRTARPSIDKISALVRRMNDTYEEYIGVKEVRSVQAQVLEAESKFIENHKKRRAASDQLKNVREQLQQIRDRLNTMPRGDEAYLKLITDEHHLIKQEKSIYKELTLKEDAERESFESFSRRLLSTQELERARQEKTKYLAALGSVAGALLGIIATTINYALKKNDFKKILQAIESRPEPQVILVPEKANSSIVEPVDTKIQEQIVELIDTLRTTHESSQSDLEYKTKVNAIIIVATSYALIALTMPLIFKMFGG